MNNQPLILDLAKMRQLGIDDLTKTAALERHFEEWLANNPDRPGYEFGLDLIAVECRLNPSSRHIGTRGEVTCDCAVASETVG